MSHPKRKRMTLVAPFEPGECCGKKRWGIYHWGFDGTVAYGCTRCGSVIARPGLERFVTWAETEWPKYLKEDVWN